MRKVLICLMLIATASCATSKKKQEIARLQMAIGTGYLTGGRYHSAISELLQAEQADPRNPEIQNNLGLTYYFLNHPKQARAHLLRAIDLNPSYTEARNNLARIDVDLGFYSEATKMANMVLSDLTYPTPEKAWINLGLVHFNQKQYPAAETAFLKAIHLDQKNCLAFDYYGRSLYESSEYAKAARVLDQSVKYCADAKFDEPHYFSALSYYKLGQREKALARLDELINTYPNGKYLQQAQTMKKSLE